MRSSSKHKGPSSKKPFQPAIGREFPVDEVPTIEAKTRGFLAKFIALSVGLALFTTGTYGLRTGNYHALEAVWAIAGPIVGAVVTYYFGAHRKDTG